jgi:CheY-like chemotaxis protein
VKTILVVDDEYAIVEALAALLGDEGYRVVSAMNGQEALDRIASDRPDLVLLDVMMPVLDGRATLAKIRDDPATAALPVVLMSAAPRAQSVAGARSDAFLAKPFGVATLLDTLSRLLK